VTRPRKPPRYTVIPHPDATADVAALATYGLEVIAAAVAIADDLAHGRVIGKELGDRHVSGNLTGLPESSSMSLVSGRNGSGLSTASSTTSPWRLSPSARAMNTPSTAPRRNASRHNNAGYKNRAVLVGARQLRTFVFSPTSQESRCLRD
jgi:hypothetical protein